jgi:hypothetical protein
MMICKREFLTEFFIETIDKIPRFLEAKPGYQPLQAKVILFVDHHAQRVLGGQKHSGSASGPRLDVAEQLPGSQASLMEHTPASVI